MKDILAVIGLPKATYMYWQKRFDRENPDGQIEEKIMEIHEANKDYGYRRVYGELRNQGIEVNKKKSTADHAEAEPTGNFFYQKEPQIQFLQRQDWYYCSKQDKKALSYTYTAPEDHYRHNGI